MPIYADPRLRNTGTGKVSLGTVSSSPFGAAGIFKHVESSKIESSTPRPRQL
jgi:hypothetical protein